MQSAENFSSRFLKEINYSLIAGLFNKGKAYMLLPRHDLNHG